MNVPIPAGTQSLTTARTTKAELLDEDGHPEGDLRANLRDIRRVNKLFGGTAAVMNNLPDLLSPTPPELLTVLDLATGSADIPLAVADWARKRGQHVSIVASDYSPDILAIAAEAVRDRPEITVERYDARVVSMPNASFDIVLCSLALHHFDPDDAVAVLQEMNRLSRRGWILNDLRRSTLGHRLTWLASHTTTRNRLTRHDAPLSIQRAYTPSELQDLISLAGISDVRITTAPWFRMIAVKGGGNGNG